MNNEGDSEMSVVKESDYDLQVRCYNFLVEHSSVSAADMERVSKLSTQPEDPIESELYEILATVREVFGDQGVIESIETKRKSEEQCRDFLGLIQRINMSDEGKDILRSIVTEERVGVLCVEVKNNSQLSFIYSPSSMMEGAKKVGLKVGYELFVDTVSFYVWLSCSEDAAGEVVFYDAETVSDAQVAFEKACKKYPNFRTD